MEGMDVVNFHNLIIRIFKSHGFVIDSTSNYDKYILATKDNINLSIGYSEPQEEVSVGNLRNFFRTAKKDNADRLIFILPRAYPANVERFADDRKIQLWDQERLEREIGRAVVSDLKTPGGADELTKELGDLLTPETKTATDSTDTTTGETIPIMVPMLQLGEESGSSGASSTKPVSASGDLTSAEEEIRDFKIVKPLVTKDDASTMANKIVKGYRFNLELIPYYIFDYTCQFNINETEDAINSGLLGINGLTSNVEDWPDDLSTVTHLEEPHTKLEVKFPVDKAFSIAKEAVVERNTKMIETKEEFESTIIFEKKKLKPKPDAIEVNSQGIHYLPVWCIEGSNGLMIIDATTGKIIKEDVFSASRFQEPESQEI